jgi:hypothetical protein
MLNRRMRKTARTVVWEGALKRPRPDMWRERLPASPQRGLAPAMNRTAWYSQRWEKAIFAQSRLPL